SITPRHTSPCSRRAAGVKCHDEDVATFWQIHHLPALEQLHRSRSAALRVGGPAQVVPYIRVGSPHLAKAPYWLDQAARWGFAAAVGVGGRVISVVISSEPPGVIQGI